MSFRLFLYPQTDLSPKLPKHVGSGGRYSATPM